MMHEDITEEKQAKEALMESRHFIDNLVETANVMIVGLNTNGDVTLFNPAAELVTGYARSEVEGQNWFKLMLPKEDSSEIHQEFIRLMSRGLPKLFENAIVTKMGKERIISWSNSVIAQNGKIVGTLSFGVDVTERKQTEGKVQQYQKRLKALATKLTVAEEAERRRIATELHDHVGQSLVLARMQMAAMRKSVGDEKLAGKLDDISETLREAVDDTRHLMFDLSPPAMHEIGLGAAISEWVEEQIEKRHGISAAFSDNMEEGYRKPLPEDVQAVLFRNVRELLINVVKHAQPDHVRVFLDSKDDILKIVVQDDGIGFDTPSADEKIGVEGGFGLFSIRERMADMGGTFEITSEPGNGCTAVLTVPMRTKEQE
jgi:PAS domain S-box-containing protein